ncbi:hypothetical protein, partial [Bacillus sp. V59.32b]|uniref:hypothetical protein n=1 Tax=Bacillus sp. V59.32b TaxID=1758642 RepID=UPI000EC96FFF
VDANTSCVSPGGVPFAEEASGLPAESERLERKSTDNQKLKLLLLVKNLKKIYDVKSFHVFLPPLNGICKMRTNIGGIFL